MSKRKTKGVEWLPAKTLSERYDVNSGWAAQHYKSGVLKRRKANTSERNRFFPSLRTGVSAYMYRVDKAALEAIEATKQRAARRAGTAKVTPQKKGTAKKPVSKAKKATARKTSAPKKQTAKTKQTAKRKAGKPKGRWLTSAALLEEFGLHQAWIYRQLKAGILKRRVATQEERGSLFGGRLRGKQKGWLYLVDDAVSEAIATTQSRSRKTTTQPKPPAKKKKTTASKAKAPAKKASKAKVPKAQKTKAPAKTKAPKAAKPRGRWLTSAEITNEFELHGSWVQNKVNSGLLKRRPATQQERETRFARLHSGQKGYLHRVDEAVLEAIEATRTRAQKKSAPEASPAAEPKPKTAPAKAPSKAAVEALPEALPPEALPQSVSKLVAGEAPADFNMVLQSLEAMRRWGVAPQACIDALRQFLTERYGITLKF